MQTMTSAYATWGELNPVTRSVPSGKVYNRKKEKHRIGVESRNGFDADFFVYKRWQKGKEESLFYDFWCLCKLKYSI